MKPEETPFLLGCNYWPRRKAMGWWANFDAGEVHEELSLVRELGLDVVRLFLLWDDFQPNPQWVSPEALQNLETVCTLAANLGLKLDITFFTGHMSGPNWAPRWLLGGSLPPHPWIRQVVSAGRLTHKGYRNMFHDPVALEAQRLLLQTVVGRLKDHPAVWMWNLGNEPDLFAWPETAQAGQEWTRSMTQLIHELDPHHPVTLGMHVASLNENNGLRASDVFSETDVAVMHAYPMYANWARHPLDPDFVPYTCALTAALAGKPVLMEEFGGCTAPPGQPSQTWAWTVKGVQRKQFMASEEDLAEYMRQVLPRLVEIGVTGALVWCFADYAPELWGKPPCNTARHERFFGLVRPDGSLKPHAAVLKAFAASRPMVQPVPDWVRIPVDPETYYQNPGQALRAGYPLYLAKMEAHEKADR